MPLYCMSAFEQIQHIKKANITSILQKDKSRRIYHSAVCPCKANKLKKKGAGGSTFVVHPPHVR